MSVTEIAKGKILVDNQVLKVVTFYAGCKKAE